MERKLLVGETADRVPCHTWQITALIKRNLIKPHGRIGRYQYFVEDQLDQIREAAERAGYLKTVGAA